MKFFQIRWNSNQDLAPNFTTEFGKDIFPQFHMSYLKSFSNDDPSCAAYMYLVHSIVVKFERSTQANCF